MTAHRISDELYSQANTPTLVVASNDTVNILTTGSVSNYGGGDAIGASGSVAHYLRVTNAGAIYANAGTGISCGDGSTIAVTASGQISAGDFAIANDDGASTLVVVNNAGYLMANQATIYASQGSAWITNSGTIAQVYSEIVTERGAISVSGGSIDCRLNNSGTITADGDYGVTLALSGGRAQVINSGTITVMGSAGAALATGSGNDRVTNTGTITGEVNLGQGNNYFNGRGGTVLGLIQTLDGNDTIYAGDGDDGIFAGGGIDYVDGGNGIDTVYYTSSATVDLRSNGVSAGAAAGATFVNVENIQTYDGTDTLIGTGGANRLDSGDGNDTLMSLGGDDAVFAGAGNDLIYGGTGNDRYDGGAGTDTLTFSAFAGGVTISLASSDVQAITAVDTARIAGIENLKGGNANDALTGDTGANALYGLGGNDRIDGSDGNDLIGGGLGNDTLIGGSGTDTLTYADVAAGVAVSLATTAQQDTKGAGLDTVSGFEYLTGSGFDDTLTGDGGINKLIGGAGNDRLDGGAGNDVLLGGQGNDTLTGGANVDTADYGDITAGVTVNLSITTQQNTVSAGLDTLSGIENLSGTTAGDTLTGDANANVLNGRGAFSFGTDTLSGGGGNDMFVGSTIGNLVIDGGADTDTLNLTGLTSTVPVEGGKYKGFDVSLDGSQPVSTGTMTSITLTSIENVIGGAAEDTLVGTGGTNVLDGSAGDDELDGGLGADRLTGGIGADTFVFDTTPGPTNVDTITDFAHLIDRISLSLDDYFVSANPGDTLPAGAFVANADGQATTASQRIVYNTATGALFYDADGSGNSYAPLQFATLTGAPTLTNTDFVLTA